MRSAIAPVAAVRLVALVATMGGCGRRPPGHPADGSVDTSDPLALQVKEARAERGTVISLLYGSNLQGEYEHCGCPSHPLGGLVRRATVVDRARAESDGVLIVDAGDMLLPPSFSDDKLQRPDPAEISRRARLILGAYARMGVHAVLPAEGDLGVGVPRLKQLLQVARVPAVASNLMDGKGGWLFERDRIVKIAGLAIGVFGVVTPLPEHQALWRAWGVTATDATTAARDEVASLKARGAKTIVALLHLGSMATARKLVQDVPGIDWAVLGHTGSQLETADVVGGAHLVEAMTMGKLAGRLDIHVVDGTGHFSDRGERAQMSTIRDDHRRQLADLERRAATDKTDQLRDYYRVRREGLTRAINTDGALIGRLPTVVTGSWYENRIIPLDDSIPDHPAIAQLVAAYNQENARRAVAGLPVGIAMRDPRVSPPRVPPLSPASASASSPAAKTGNPPDNKTDQPTPPLRYAGSAACGRCHPSAWSVFQTTKHARALAALVPTRRQRDPTCVGCHSTGFMLPGGSTSIRVATDLLKDVGCESCHGPSLEHVSSADKKATTHRGVEERVCRGCHTPDQTNGEFELKSFRGAILGRGHGA